MCAVRISDLTVEKMISGKKKPEGYVKICDSFVRSENDMLLVDYEQGRVFWHIDLASVEGSEVKLFDVGCFQEIAVSTAEIREDKVSFNTDSDDFVRVFELFSSYDYSVKATLGCAMVCIQSSSNASAVLAVIAALNGLAAPILQFAKSGDSITILIEERYLLTLLQALARSFQIIERRT